MSDTLALYVLAQVLVFCLGGVINGMVLRRRVSQRAVKGATVLLAVAYSILITALFTAMAYPIEGLTFSPRATVISFLSVIASLSLIIPTYRVDFIEAWQKPKENTP